MKAFDKIFVTAIVLILILFAAANIAVANIAFLTSGNRGGRLYRVEIARLAEQIRDSGYDSISLTECQYVTDIIPYEGTDPVSFFQDTESDYAIRIINDRAYRFEYSTDTSENRMLLFLCRPDRHLINFSGIPVF